MNSDKIILLFCSYHDHAQVGGNKSIKNSHSILRSLANRKSWTKAVFL